MKFEKPTLLDIPQMLSLVEPEILKGNILMRSQDEIANAIRSYWIARKEGEIIGFCALHIYTPKLAEVRSLIVRSDFQGRGIGGKLVELVMQEGGGLGVREFLVLTYRDGFFKRLGFEVITREEIPSHKVLADCKKCKHFSACNEIALLKKI